MGHEEKRDSSQAALARWRRHTRRLLLVTALPGMLAACGPAEQEGRGAVTEASEGAILGGRPIKDRPEVGLFDAPGICTGTLITPSHFLTASHCIDYRGRSEGGEFKIHIPEEKVFPVRRVYSIGNQRLGSHDLAVGELFSPVPSEWATPASIALSTPGQGTMLTAVGYGCTESTCNIDKRARSYRRSPRGEVTGSGDSGGPHFLGVLADNGPIGLVTSGGSGGNELYADPPMHRRQILELINALGTQDICYRAHVAEVGWMAPSCNGVEAGTTGRGLDIRMLQIWSGRVRVCYQAFVRGQGWQHEVCDGDTAGVQSPGLPIDGLIVRIDGDRPNNEALLSQAHIGHRGWLGQVREGEVAGEPGTGRGMQSFRVKFE